MCMRLSFTFFSPSGYEVRKTYEQANFVSYLPADSVSNARTFLEIVKPVAAFFVKYDLWLNFLSEIEKRKIPAFLVSAKIEEKSAFVKSPIRSMYRKAFHAFNWIFTQDESTAELLKTFTGKKEISVAGDTRFDRVLQIASNAEEIAAIREFTAGHFCVIAGSMWPKDEEILFEAIKRESDFFDAVETESFCLGASANCTLSAFKE